MVGHQKKPFEYFYQAPAPKIKSDTAISIGPAAGMPLS
jgi:hypothetical protein